MDSKTCLACKQYKLISFFRTEGKVRVLKQYFAYRNKTARSKDKNLLVRILLGTLHPNKRRLLPILFYRPAIRPSSRFPRRSSFFKRRRSLGLALEKQGLLKRTFRRRDENVTYKDFSSSSGSLPFIVALLP